MTTETDLDYLEAPFRSSSPPVKSGRSSCDHDQSLKLLTQDDGLAAGCGLCWLTIIWESEVPGRIHAYKLLAENGNPQVAPAFWSHVEASLGLVRPQKGQNLQEFRLARGQLYRVPSRKQYPLLRALWNTMGYQPILTTALIRSLQGRDLLEIAAELNITAYGASAALQKGVRLVLREFRSNGR